MGYGAAVEVPHFPFYNNFFLPDPLDKQRLWTPLKLISTIILDSTAAFFGIVPSYSFQDSFVAVHRCKIHSRQPRSASLASSASFCQPRFVSLAVSASFCQPEDSRGSLYFAREHLVVQQFQHSPAGQRRMTTSGQKPDKKGGKPRSSKAPGEKAVDGHDGSYDPTEQSTAQSGSSGTYSAGKNDSHKSNTTRTKDKSTSGTKVREQDPTGHDGSYDPSAG